MFMTKHELTGEPVVVILVTNTAADRDSRTTTRTTFSLKWVFNFAFADSFQNTTVDTGTLLTRIGGNIAMQICAIITMGTNPVKFHMIHNRSSKYQIRISIFVPAKPSNDTTNLQPMISYDHLVALLEICTIVRQINTVWKQCGKPLHSYHSEKAQQQICHSESFWLLPSHYDMVHFCSVVLVSRRVLFPASKLSRFQPSRNNTG